MTRGVALNGGMPGRSPFDACLLDCITQFRRHAFVRARPPPSFRRTIVCEKKMGAELVSYHSQNKLELRYIRTKGFPGTDTWN